MTREKRLLQDAFTRSMRPAISAEMAMSVRPKEGQLCLSLPWGGFGEFRVVTRAELQRELRKRAGRQKISPASPESKPMGPPWIYGFVLFDGRSEEFGRLIHRNLCELDEATGRGLTLTYIGDPNELCEVYEAQRNPGLAEQDALDAHDYLILESRQQAVHHCRRQRHRLRRILRVNRDLQPCIAFLPYPFVGPPAILRIRPEWLGTAQDEGELVDALIALFERGVDIARLAAESASVRELIQALDRDVQAHFAAWDAQRTSRARELTSPGSPLRLERLMPDKRNQTLVARLVGDSSSGAIDKPLGVRQLFFLVLFARSERSHPIDGQAYTAFTEAEAAKQLESWRGSGFLNVSGRDTPTQRVTKNWGEFLRGMGSHARLFSTSKDGEGNKLYCVALPPGQIQSDLPPLATFLRGSSE